MHDRCLVLVPSPQETVHAVQLPQCEKYGAFRVVWAFLAAYIEFCGFLSEPEENSTIEKKWELTRVEQYDVLSNIIMATHQICRFWESQLAFWEMSPRAARSIRGWLACSSQFPDLTFVLSCFKKQQIFFSWQQIRNNYGCFTLCLHYQTNDNEAYSVFKKSEHCVPWQ